MTFGQILQLSYLSYPINKKKVLSAYNRAKLSGLCCSIVDLKNLIRYVLIQESKEKLRLTVAAEVLNVIAIVVYFACLRMRKVPPTGTNISRS